MLARDQGNKDIDVNLTLTGSDKNQVLTNCLDCLNKKSQNLLARDLGLEVSAKTVSDFLAKKRLRP
jgi:hypothetical protein